MSKEHFAALTAGLGKRLGLPGVELADEGTRCLLTFDAFPVNLTYIESEDAVLAFSVAATLPHDGSGDLMALYAELLEGNVMFQQTQGFTLGATEAVGVVVQGYMPMRMLDDRTVDVWMENLVNVAEYWEQRCGELLADTAEDAAANTSLQTGMLKV